MKKTFIYFITAALLVVTIMPFPAVEGKVKGYHSGDAISYNGNIIIASTDSGQLEVFKMNPNDSGVTKFISLTSYNPRFGTPQDFMDVLLRTEDGALYAYVVNGRSLFKYDISDLNQARIVKEVQDGGWDWLGGLQVINNQVATTGSRGVKMWNNDLQVVDAYTIINPGDKTYNTTPASSSKYIFTLYEGKIKVFDREARTFITDIPVNLKWGSDWYKREMYNSPSDNSIVVVDDESVKKINFNGEIIDSFKHTSNLGYDVVPSEDRNYVYFSDGIGIVKLRTSDLKVISYLHTVNLGNGNGWAMGMKTVNDGNGEKLVVFNNGNIIILTSDLKPYKSKAKAVLVTAIKEDTYPDINEPLSLSIDRNHAAGNSIVSLSGKGFGANENVSINFLDVITNVTADNFGRFSKNLVVPDVTHRKTDIKVLGELTSFKYSLGFEIE